MSTPVSSVSPLRIRRLGGRPVRNDGAYVLYWMAAYRRTRSNLALQRAADWSRHLGIPLVVFAELGLDYPYASERFHAFTLDAMADVQRRLDETPARFLPYVEPEPDAGEGLLAALTAAAAVVITDDAPLVGVADRISATAAESPVLVEAVDHNSLLPLAVGNRSFLRAYDLRRFHQRELGAYLTIPPGSVRLDDLPQAPPGLLADIEQRWPSSLPERALLEQLPVDRSVPATPLGGGEDEARQVLQRFIANRLSHYEDRNHPDAEATSGLSPYLHFGNISVHEVFDAVAAAEGWSPDKLAAHATGGRSGWWGMTPEAEGFLDQVVTWRELGYRAAHYVTDNETYGVLPEWARATLAQHASDPRPYVYSREQLDAGETHDEIWNAAQRQLRHDGAMHNYLRMLWGKKILEWTRHPEEAHDIMFELNDRYALDGSDPNSISGIHWVLGRYDRAWGPERPIFGKVRYMSSDATRRKLRLTEYLGQSKMLNT